MRTSLIIFGVIFLVIGLLLYFIPLQELKANTTTIAADGGVDTRTSSAKVTVPVEWAYASIIIGFILFVMGVLIPNPQKNNTKKYYNNGNGREREIVREKNEKHRSRRDDD